QEWFGEWRQPPAACARAPRAQAAAHAVGPEPAALRNRRNARPRFGAQQLGLVERARDGRRRYARLAGDFEYRGASGGLTGHGGAQAVNDFILWAAYDSRVTR